MTRAHRSLRSYKSVVSTNDTAKKLARDGACHGTVVCADEQTGGRGQYGRGFVSPVGGLYMSVILRGEYREDLTARAGQAVRDALAELYPPLDPTVKPVNDVLIDGKKVCGILVEGANSAGRQEFTVVGIGVNVNAAPEGIDRPVTCIARELGRETDIAALRENITGRILSL